MKQLTEFARIVRDIKLNTSDFLTEDNSSGNKMNQFYRGLLMGKFDSNEDAAQQLYNKSAQHSSYKNMKAKFKQRLFQTLVFFDEKKIKDERKAAYLWCSRQLIIGFILKAINMRSLYTDIYKKVLMKAVYYDLSDCAIKSARDLSGYAALVSNDLKSFETYTELVNKHINIYGLELKSGELYLRLVHPYTIKKVNNKDTHAKAKAYFAELSPFLSSCPSPVFHVNTYYIEVIIYQVMQDYERVISICEKAVCFLESKQYTFLNGIIAFNHLAAVCKIQLSQFSQGKLALEKIDQLLDPGSTNWFINKDLHLLLAFHAQNYQEGYRNFIIANGHRRFKSLPSHLNEKFQIWEAYLHFLVAIKKVIPDVGDKKFLKFRKAKFLNSVPVYSKDKRGLNIPILIVQILFTIVDGKYDLAVDRIEAIDKYCSRYLKQGSGYRSNCFIKMLNQIPLAGFHRIAAERKAKPYLEKLKVVPINIAEQPEDVELIPYEDLWALIIEYLGVKVISVDSGK